MANLVGERRALAAAILAFYGFLFLIVALAPPPGWRACFAALALVYGTGFFSLVAGYFWARWFCIGLGISGLISAGVSIFQIGPEPVLLFYGGTHAAVSLVLWGAAMARAFDGRKEWRERFHLDEAGTHRLGKAIIRVGISLPYVVMYALAPREDAGAALIAGAAGALATLGLLGLVRMRSWGVFALGGAAVVTALSVATLSSPIVALAGGYGVHVLLTGTVGAVFLALAVAPFAEPAWRYLRGR
jgi:hypothetical protein